MMWVRIPTEDFTDVTLVSEDIDDPDDPDDPDNLYCQKSYLVIKAKEVKIVTEMKRSHCDDLRRLACGNIL